jgi:hypothetical protein
VLDQHYDDDDADSYIPSDGGDEVKQASKKILDSDGTESI